MVKVIGLAVAVAACWTCAPAQADVPRLEAPSLSVPATAKVVSSAIPAAGQVTSSVAAASAPAEPAIQAAAAAAEPVVDEAVTTTTLRVAQGRAGESGGLRTGTSSFRRAAPARLRRSAPPRRMGAPVRDSRPARPAPVVVRHPHAGAAASRPASAPQERDGPPQPLPAPRADGGVSAGAAGLFAAGLAMLAGALMLVAPRLRRRLVLDPAVLRPAAFVALLERPG
jgi:hypothetical protein